MAWVPDLLSPFPRLDKHERMLDSTIGRVSINEQGSLEKTHEQEIQGHLVLFLSVQEF